MSVCMCMYSFIFYVYVCIVCVYVCIVCICIYCMYHNKKYIHIYFVMLYIAQWLSGTCDQI
jgi:hypothetical protein